MQTLDFDTLTSDQLRQWADKESEVFEQLARLLKAASESEKLRIAAIAILESATFEKEAGLLNRIKFSVEMAFLRNTSVITSECSRLIGELPLSDSKLQLAQFIIEKMREDSEAEGDFQVAESDTDSNFHQVIFGSDGIDTIPF